MVGWQEDTGRRVKETPQRRQNLHLLRTELILLCRRIASQENSHSSATYHITIPQLQMSLIHMGKVRVKVELKSAMIHKVSSIIVGLPTDIHSTSQSEQNRSDMFTDQLIS